MKFRDNKKKTEQVMAASATFSHQCLPDQSLRPLMLEHAVLGTSTIFLSDQPKIAKIISWCFWSLIYYQFIVSVTSSYFWYPYYIELADLN